MESPRRWHRCAGGVVIDADRRVLLIDQTFASGERQFTMPKGHVEAGETDVQAAVREIREETGIVVGEPRLRLPRTSYRFGRPGEGRRKVVAWFLFTGGGDTNPGSQDEGVADAWWEPAEAALERLTHVASRTLLLAALSRHDRIVAGA